MENQEVTNLGNNQGGIYNNSIQQNSEPTVQNMHVQVEGQVQTSVGETTVYNGNKANEVINAKYQNLTTDNTTVPQTPTQNSVNMQQEENTESTSIIEEPTVSDRLIVNVKELQKMVSQAKKLATGDTLILLSQVFYLVFDNNGLKITATNGNETVDIINRKTKYTQEVRISVDAKKFAELVSNITCEQVEFIYNDEQSILTLQTDNGYFRFSQAIDLSTGLPITLQHNFEFSYDDMKPLEYSALNELVNKTKPIRKFAEGFSVIEGVYFTDIAISTDSNLMLMQETLATLRDEEFFIGSVYLDLLSQLTIDNDKCRYTLVREEGKVIAIVVSDGSITFSGRTKENERIPVKTCRNFWKTDFVNKIKVSTSRCYNILKAVSIFVNHNNDNDNVLFTINGNSLEVKAIDGSAKDLIVCDNVSNYNVSIKLPIFKIMGIIQTITLPEFTISIDPNNSQCICFEYDNFKCIVALSTEQE